MAIKKCRECGADVSTEAKACPKCGASKPTESITDRIVGGAGTIILGLLLGDFVFGWGLVFSGHKSFVQSPIHLPASMPTPAAEMPPAVATTTNIVEKSAYSFPDLRGILDVYSSNEALFYSAIKGKRMRATAPYKTLSKSMFSDTEYSLLVGDRPFTDIRCSVPAVTATSQLVTLGKGDTIVVNGIISDVVLGTLVLTPCIVER